MLRCCCISAKYLVQELKKLCCWIRQKKHKMCWAERKAESDNIFFNKLWVCNFFIAFKNNEVIYVAFSLTCSESLGVFKLNVSEHVGTILLNIWLNSWCFLSQFFVKDIINPYNCLLKNANFSSKTAND